MVPFSSGICVCNLPSIHFYFRSTTFSASEIRELFGGFCPISGSPVRPSSDNLWSNLEFKKSSNPGQTESGSVHVCCWPCVCDLQEFVKTDTLDVDTKNGRTTFDVLVIGKRIHLITHIRGTDGKKLGGYRLKYLHLKKLGGLQSSDPAKTKFETVLPTHLIAIFELLEIFKVNIQK